MESSWEFAFVIDGLPAPRKAIRIKQNLMVRGVRSEYFESEVRVRLKRTPQRSSSEATTEAHDIVSRFLSCYLLIAPIWASKNPTFYLGSTTPDPHGKIGDSPLIVARADIMAQPKTIAICEDKINKTKRLLEKIEQFVEKKHGKHIQLALDFYRFGRIATRSEEQLINYMIALEALYGREAHDIRYRLALRVATVLGRDNNYDSSQVFKDIHNYYGNRNSVVHGLKEIKLHFQDLERLGKYLQDSFRKLTFVKLKKNAFLDLVDKSHVNQEAKKDLNKVIDLSVAQWDEIVQ
jgi:hypothetical protein